MAITKDQSELIQEWIEDARILIKCHMTRAANVKRQNSIIGIISAIFSGVVGSSIFASLGEKETNTFLIVLVGLISLSATILTSVMAFLKLPEIANQNHNSGVQYAEIRKELELLLKFNKNNDVESELKKIKDKWDDIRSNALPISSKIIKKYK